MKLVSLRLPEELIDNLTRKAKSEDRSFNKYVTRVLMAHDLDEDGVLGSSDPRVLTQQADLILNSSVLRDRIKTQAEVMEPVSLASRVKTHDNLCEHFQPKGSCLVKGCKYGKGKK